MDNNLAAEFSCRKRPGHLEIELARQRQMDPNILSGRDKMYVLYVALGIDIDYDEVFGDDY